jgi:hypothetical protein
MPDRSIKIVPVNPADPKGSASFAPQGGHPGGTQEAWEGDAITWNNTTDAEHWPWPTDANYQPLTLAAPERNQADYLSDNIATHNSSRPTYSPKPPPRTIYYFCKNHPNDQHERGTIRVVPVPQP